MNFDLIAHGLSYLLLAFVFSVGHTQTESQILQDCDNCPSMIRIPAGSAIVGSYPEEIDRKKGERMRTEVTIEKPYLMASTEVTIAQFRIFMQETNYQSVVAEYKGQQLVGCNYYDGKSYGYIAAHSWENPGYPQREDAPVVCVSWSDAKAYAEWLSQKTGRKYRIPSAIEFEYASRAGSSGPWFWGTDSEKACEFANIGDRSFAQQYPSRPSFPCDDGYVYTSSVAKFKPNGFGLYDMVGNAWEWTSDCYHEDLADAPKDGTAWEEEEGGDCTFRTPKGGSWISGIAWSRAAVRSRDGAHYKSFMLGFRVVAEVE